MCDDRSAPTKYSDDRGSGSPGKIIEIITSRSHFVVGTRVRPSKSKRRTRRASIEGLAVEFVARQSLPHSMRSSHFGQIDADNAPRQYVGGDLGAKGGSHPLFLAYLWFRMTSLERVSSSFPCFSVKSCNHATWILLPRLKDRIHPPNPKRSIVWTDPFLNRW
jgi:hypothetical protein